jgi:hypothetical protein
MSSSSSSDSNDLHLPFEFIRDGCLNLNIGLEEVN